MATPDASNVVMHVEEAKQREPGDDTTDTEANLLDEISKDLLCGCPKLADKMKGESWALLHCAVSEGREDLVTRIFSVAPEMIGKEAKAVRRGAEVVTALDIAFEKRHENVLIRLFELCPSLIDVIADDYWRNTVLHRAALKGLDTVVAHLLAVKPQLISAVTRKGQTALDVAAFGGHLAVVQRLLAASPALINATDNIGETALHRAASSGNLAVVAHLLAAKPELIDAVEGLGWTALHSAATSGSVPVAEHLLAARPELISAVSRGGDSVLHVAATSGNCTMVEYLLSVSPALIDAVDKDGSTVLHEAPLNDGPPLTILRVARTLLAIKPDLISMTNNDGHTMLHLLVQHCKSKEVLEEMLRLYPEALRVGKVNDTPFHVAIAKENFVAIELFQWQLTWEEIENAYASCNNTSYEQRFRPVLETQCESLSLWLLPEVIGTVFEYLGFERAKKREPASPLLFPSSSLTTTVCTMHEEDTIIMQ